MLGDIYGNNFFIKKAFIFINNSENTDNSVERYIDKDVDINDLICRTFVNTNTWKVFYSMTLEYNLLHCNYRSLAYI